MAKILETGASNLKQVNFTTKALGGLIDPVQAIFTGGVEGELWQYKNPGLRRPYTHHSKSFHPLPRSPGATYP